MLPLPPESTDELHLADWLELRAILADDHNSSFGDLERVLTRAATFDGKSEALENKLADVSKEIEQRARAAGQGYPFSNSGSGLEVSAQIDDSSYIFCLCLSYATWNQPRGSKVHPSRIFESLAAEAAKTYIDCGNGAASSLRFGSPRVDPLPKSFREAVNRLCIDHIGEGGGWPPTKVCTPNLRPKDGGLDLVAWREWPDKLPGKIMLWGACATGADWESKTRDLTLSTFTGEWLATQPITPIIRAFFVPHRIHADRWSLVARNAGLVFERCRIASLVNTIPPDASIHGNAAEWLQGVLTRLRNS